MQVSRRDIGYTVYSRLEAAIRLWLRDALLNGYGSEWSTAVPDGVVTKAFERASSLSTGNFEDPLALLDEVDIPDLIDVVASGYTTGTAA